MNLSKQPCNLTILRVERRKERNEQNQFKDWEWMIVQEELLGSWIFKLLTSNLASALTLASLLQLKKEKSQLSCTWKYRNAEREFKKR